MPWRKSAMASITIRASQQPPAFPYRTKGLKYLPPFRKVSVRDRTTSKMHTAMEKMSIFENFLPEYQVRFFSFPKPRSSMALEMVSIRSREDKIKGIRMALAAFRRFTKLAFLLISVPLAC